MSADSSSNPSAGVPPRRGPLARGLFALAIVVAGAVLVAAFVFVRFPFERLRDGMAVQAGRALGAEVTIGSLEPTFAAGLPGFVAGDVRVTFPDGALATAQRALVRPAWSPSWLGGTPSFHVDAQTDVGIVAGAVTLGDEPAFDGRLERVDLSRLPLQRLAGGASLYGALDLEADLRLRNSGPVGDARFEARDGSFSAPTLPIAVPFQTLRGSVRFAEDGSMTLDDVDLDGPMLSGRVTGGTGPGPSLWLAPLDLDVHLEARDRSLRPALRSAGVALRPDGTVDVKVHGNLTAPMIR